MPSFAPAWEIGPVGVSRLPTSTLFLELWLGEHVTSGERGCMFRRFRIADFLLQTFFCVNSTLSLWSAFYSLLLLRRFTMIYFWVSRASASLLWLFADLCVGSTTFVLY